MNILIENLVKTFGTKTALNIQELKINSGELVGIVGNNGAGKTTLFRLMLNLINGDSGSVRIDGEEVSKEDNWKERCGAFIDSGFLIEFLTPEEYFAFIAKLYNIGKVDLEERLASYSKLMSEEVLGQKKYIRDFLYAKVSAPTGWKQKIINFVGRYSFLSFLTNFFDKRYATKGLKAVKGLGSYPCEFTTPEKEAIIRAIQSH